MNWTYDSSDKQIIRSSNEGRSGVVIIPKTILSYGYNDQHIIVRSCSQENYLNSKKKINSEALKISYHVISIADNGKVVGCDQKEEFNALREQLNIDEALQFEYFNK